MKPIKNLCRFLVVVFSLLVFTTANADNFNLADAFAAKQKSIPFRVERLFIPTTVPVQVTVANASWVDTIYICNTSGNTIPLKSLEFRFNYSVPMPTTIWGDPWAAWKLVSQTNGQVVLTGGTPSTPDLPSDPNCMQPLTIQFNSPPTNPLPTGPFEFKADGGPVNTTGALNVTVSATPAPGLLNPTIKVVGPNTNSQQQVTWGSVWNLTTLTPGSYTVTGVAITAGQNTYTADPVTVMVNAQATAQATITYKAAATTGNVTVSLINPPTAQVPVTFTGSQTINQNVTNNAVLTLPSDTYQVSSTIPNYTATATPNPLTVPTQTALTITYTPVSSNTSVRTLNFTNRCPFPVWFGFISGATPNRNGGNCASDADCYEGSTCVDRGAGGKQCFWKNPAPDNNNFQLAANGGTNAVKIPIYTGGLGAIWSGAVAGRTNCTGAGCETADCGGGTGACPPGRGFGQPATQAEFTFQKNAPDFYDVEIINGMNLPVEMSAILTGTIPADPYNCGGAGAVTARGPMGACSWNMQPPSNDYVWVKAGGTTCTTDANCTVGNKCGLSFNPGQTPAFKKTCGKQLGYWTANQVCGIQNNYGAPFNCQQPLPAPQGNLNLSNLYGCTQVGSCYQNGANPTCCGCANWDQVGAQVPPAPYTQQCVSSNPAWVSDVQSKLLWIKQACPSIYTYPFDDMSSTFVCTIMKDNNGTQVNSVNYNITFCPGGATGGVSYTKQAKK